MTSKSYSKKTVVIISNSTWNVFNFRVGIVKKLINNNFKVFVVAPNDNSAYKLIDLGCHHVDIKIDNKGVNFLLDLYLIFQYIKIFYQLKPSLILSYTIKPNIYGSIAATILSIPLVNNISGLGTVFIKGGMLEKIVSFLYKVGLKKAKRVFFQNNDDKNLFIRKNLVNKTQVDVLPGSGVDLRYYQPSVRHTPNKNQGEFIFLLIARLIWDKGIKEYVDAARIVKENTPNVKFQMLGFLDVENRTAVLRSDIDSWVNDGLVEYLGSADDVRPYIERSDCVVLPSYREGTPKTLLEAGAMRKPIITTNVAGCKDVVDDGKNGFICNVRDAVDLSNKMKQMASMDPVRLSKMGAMSRKKIEDIFDEKLVVGKYMSIIDRISN
jgi:glycosyltransferase involved in cell wall biosynthesis